MTDYTWWCAECGAFVDEDHRCEQWSDVTRIPVAALDAWDREKIPSLIRSLWLPLGTPADNELHKVSTYDLVKGALEGNAAMLEQIDAAKNAAMGCGLALSHEMECPVLTAEVKSKQQEESLHPVYQEIKDLTDQPAQMDDSIPIVSPDTDKQPAEVHEDSHTPEAGDYVLATKWQDGDPQDQWCVGSYDREERGRHFVLNGYGEQFRANGFRRAEKISRELGTALLSAEHIEKSVWDFKIPAEPKQQEPKAQEELTPFEEGLVNRVRELEAENAELSKELTKLKQSMVTSSAQLPAHAQNILIQAELKRVMAENAELEVWNKKRIHHIDMLEIAGLKLQKRIELARTFFEDNYRFFNNTPHNRKWKTEELLDLYRECMDMFDAPLTLKADTEETTDEAGK